MMTVTAENVMMTNQPMSGCGGVQDILAPGGPAARRIADDQIWKLVAYIKSMRTSFEADPPS